MATNTNPFYTYSATAGSSKTLQKPQDGGDNNQWGNYINTDLDEIVSAVNALSDKIADANEKTLVDFTAITNAVNHIGITNAATGNPPQLGAAGSDTNVDLTLYSKGTGDINVNAGSDINLNPSSGKDINVPQNIGLTFGNDTERIEGDNTNLTIYSGAAINLNSGTLDLSAQTVDVTLNAAVDALNIDSNTLSIDASNNRVGISDASPEQKLSIDVNSSNTTATTLDGLEIGNSNTTVNNGAAISFTHGAGGANHAKIGAIHEDRSSGSEDSSLFFGTLGGGAYSEKMRIGSTGSITTPNGEFNGSIGTSATFPFDGTTDAGRVIQIKYIDNAETNTLDTTYTVRWNYSITLKSGDSKILIIHTDLPHTHTGGGLGRLIYRNNSAYSDAQTSQPGTLISDKAPADSSGPYIAYMGGSNGYPILPEIVLDDVSSSFNAGDTVYYGHYYRRYTTATVQIPAPGDVQNAHFSTIVMELEK